jgi:hypothetical protein
MSERETRIAMNEALFREMNERVEEQVVSLKGDEEPFVIVCECGDIECMDRIWVTPAEYDAAHSDPAQFVVVDGHVAPDIEEVVAQRDGYLVVRKHGVAGEIVADLGGSEAS